MVSKAIIQLAPSGIELPPSWWKPASSLSLYNFLHLSLALSPLHMITHTHTHTNWVTSDGYSRIPPLMRVSSSRHLHESRQRFWRDCLWTVNITLVGQPFDFQLTDHEKFLAPTDLPDMLCDFVRFIMLEVEWHWSHSGLLNRFLCILHSLMMDCLWMSLSLQFKFSLFFFFYLMRNVWKCL